MNTLETIGLISVISTSAVIVFVGIPLAYAVIKDRICERRYNAQLSRQERQIALAIRLRREGRWLEYADIDE